MPNFILGWGGSRNHINYHGKVTWHSVREVNSCFSSWPMLAIGLAVQAVLTVLGITRDDSRLGDSLGLG